MSNKNKNRFFPDMALFCDHGISIMLHFRSLNHVLKKKKALQFFFRLKQLLT
jgi:hypothetical protein